MIAFKNMAGKESWKVDEELENDLKKCVCLNMQCLEILNFMLKDYGNYKWSL